jgi:hypothetical protein
VQGFDFDHATWQAGVVDSIADGSLTMEQLDKVAFILFLSLSLFLSFSLSLFLFLSSSLSTSLPL